MQLNRVVAVIFAVLAAPIWSSVGRAQTASSATDAYQDIAEKIISAGRLENDSWLKIQELCDDIGNRVSGSESLQHAIQWAQTSLKSDGQENVRAEEVSVRKWVRGNEYCELVVPRSLKIAMLGLGGSVATPKEGITAEVIVVKSKEELENMSHAHVLHAFMV